MNISQEREGEGDRETGRRIQLCIFCLKVPLPSSFFDSIFKENLLKESLCMQTDEHTHTDRHAADRSVQRAKTHLPISKVITIKKRRPASAVCRTAATAVIACCLHSIERKNNKEYR